MIFEVFVEGGDQVRGKESAHRHVLVVGGGCGFGTYVRVVAFDLNGIDRAAVGQARTVGLDVITPIEIDICHPIRDSRVRTGWAWNAGVPAFLQQGTQAEVASDQFGEAFP